MKKAIGTLVLGALVALPGFWFIRILQITLWWTLVVIWRACSGEVSGRIKR